MDPEPRILKGAAPVAARRIDGVVFDTDRRVRELVAAAEERARAVLARAAAEREQVVAAAREEGWREGQARAAAVLVAAAGERDRLLSEAPREVARLALAVARKVLGRELREPDAVLGLAEAAVATARGRREVVLRVNPADAQAVRAGEGRLRAALGGPGLELRLDPAVPAGGAVVDTEGGRVDAGVEAQLEVIARVLEEALP